MKAIYILCVRQLKRYIRSPARIIGSLGQPILFLVALGFGFGAMFARAGGGDYIEFLSPGIISMAILFNAVFSRNRDHLGPAVRIPEGNAGGAGLAAGDRVRQDAGRRHCGHGAGDRRFRDLPDRRIPVRSARRYLPLAIVFMFMISLLFAGIGTVFGSVLQDMQGFPLIINFLIMPIFFFSGAIFPTAGLPKVLQIGLRLNPLSYGVDGLRGSCSNDVRVRHDDRSRRRDDPDRDFACHRELLLLENSAVGNADARAR